MVTSYVSNGTPFFWHYLFLRRIEAHGSCKGSSLAEVWCKPRTGHVRLCARVGRASCLLEGTALVGTNSRSGSDCLPYKFWAKALSPPCCFFWSSRLLFFGGSVFVVCLIPVGVSIFILLKVRKIKKNIAISLHKKSFPYSTSTNINRPHGLHRN